MNAILILFVTAIIVLFSNLKGKHMLSPFMGVIGILLAIATFYLKLPSADWLFGSSTTNMFFFDDFSRKFSVASLVITLFILLSLYNSKDLSEVSEVTALILFSLSGALILFSYTNMFMLFLGVEILSIPLYVLAGVRKKNQGGNEAALKYFLMGAFATGFFMMGITLIYGATGSFELNGIYEFVGNSDVNNLPALLKVGLLLFIAGLGFKIAAAPFHFWSPDVYQGSPTAITLFMSTVVKMAGFAAIFRILTTSFGLVRHEWITEVSVMAGASLIIGNLTAVFQKDAKRTLAYSSIGHAGFMLLAVLSLVYIDYTILLYYLFAYSLANLIIFNLLLSSSHESNNLFSFDSFNGMSRRYPIYSFCIAIGLLSMAGLPPFAGFFGKYYLFFNAFENHFWLVIIAIICSAIGVYYYFRLLIAMYFKEPADHLPYQPSTLNKATVISCTALLLLLSFGLNVFNFL